LGAGRMSIRLQDVGDEADVLCLAQRSLGALGHRRSNQLEQVAGGPAAPRIGEAWTRQRRTDRSAQVSKMAVCAALIVGVLSLGGLRRRIDTRRYRLLGGADCAQRKRGSAGEQTIPTRPSFCRLVRGRIHLSHGLELLL